MTSPDVLNEKLTPLLQDKARLRTVQQIAELGVSSDPDFDTAIDLIKAKFGAEAAFVAIIDESEVHYQTISGESLPDGEALDGIARLSLEGHSGQMLLSGEGEGVSEASAKMVLGVPLSVGGQRIGSLCLIGLKPEQERAATDVAHQGLMAQAQFLSSLFELKRSARKNAMSELHLSRANVRYALALKAGGIATFSWDREADIIECDALSLEFLDLEGASQISSRRVLRQIDPKDLHAIRHTAEQLLGSDDDVSFEFRVRTTGRYLLALCHVMESDDEGKPLKLIGVVLDLTNSKQSEAKMRLLLREVNHRVKNMLAMLQSLAGQTLRHSQTPEGFTRAFSGRLQALASSHSLLSDQEWDDIELSNLLRTQIKPYASHFDEQVIIEGPSYTVDADAAIALGLAVHELATNAMRHGALSRREGRLHIKMLVQGAGASARLTIAWTEQGGPVLEEQAHRQGFGSILIKHSLDKIIGSRVRIRFDPTGAVVEFSLPLKK
ncbi:Two-component sensor histidine kinase, contains HisKA and HATPase domains [Cohaesibacter sp. ES.047]|uniref:sensor histidine kinase n=1 Tax=Cohaesibacter sp. ES.047 TaxID=1798205 RepID=UPI000BB6E359|nr:HWE histidine kinase domain-containing protein [Cohaesibacter sp. ES.047]SNY91317.1 Two-component sensor histidine kinase, contains HisKA and HATPase domains [Cohaesibacter sp. ES.047]